MASYDILNVNTGAYSTAAGRGGAAAKAVESAADTLLHAMGAAASSAGHGAGDDFVAKYEPGANLVLQETANLIGGLYTIGGMFADTGNWHEELEKFNTTGKPFIPPSATPTPVVMIPQPASIQGGTGQRPNGWTFVEHLVTEMWPDADTAKLTTLAGAFGTFGDAVTAARHAHLAETMSSFDAYISTETPAATAYVDELGTNMNTLANHAYELRDSITGFATYVTHSTTDVIDILTQMLATLAGGAIVAALLTPETAGLSAGADGLASAGEISSAASRINTTLKELRGLQFFKYASAGWEGLNNLDKAAEGAGVVRTLAVKAGAGLAKSGYRGAYVYGPVASVATLAMTGSPREAVTAEVAVTAGSVIGGFVEGLGGGTKDLLGTAGKKAATTPESAGAGTADLDGSDAAPADEGAYPQISGAPTASDGGALAPAASGILKKFVEPVGTMGGAAAGTFIELKIENKVSGQELTMDISEDLLRHTMEKNNVLVVAPRVAAVG